MANQMGLEDSPLEMSDDSDAPPMYEDVNGDHTDAAQVRVDGRIDVNLNSQLAKTLSRMIVVKPDEHTEPPPSYTDQQARGLLSLNIVIQVVGSRGDVQPFVALGNELQHRGHRVRLATHDTFKDFVTGAGLEFYPIGGDPAALMAYMVKNPGLLPSMKALRSGEVQKKREMMAVMLDGCWKACIEPDLDSKAPFVADAIIANPPSFAHVHCAETLGIPVHIMFTMPWTSTEAFPHPLANIRSSNFDEKLTNRLSYAVVDWMMWQGLGDVVNSWRKRQNLEPVPASEGPFLPDLLQIPTTYCWSPALVPKPADWPSRIDVCGFFFRQPPQYSPPSNLDAFLRSGPAPVYIGFGSIVIENPEEMTQILLDAVKAAGVRAIISKGWSNLGDAVTLHSEDILFLGDCPHEWLFQHVSAVVHHGGAGTTACGLANSCPTVIVPFFGDQPFWGDMVATAGAGPKPIPHKKLNSSNLSAAIQFCLSEEALKAARQISERMSNERGVMTAVESFQKNLPIQDIACDLLPRYAATWEVKSPNGILKVSNIAAEILLNEDVVQAKHLKLYQSKTINIEIRRWDPITASASSMFGVVGDLTSSATGIATGPYAEYERSRKNALASGASEKDSKNIDQKTAGAMALASAKSLGKFNSSIFKGLMVDVPLALAEGFRATPKLYGEAVPDHEPIKDWKSGALVAGKEIATGFAGLADLVTEPYKGAKKDGAEGFFIGVGKGTASMTTKMASGAMGLVAYPGQGIYKSIYNATHKGTRNQIAAARRQEGLWLFDRHQEEVTIVLDRWKTLTRQR